MNIIDRKKAKELNLKRYFTGKPCKHGHIVERVVLNGICVQCSAENTLRWQKANPGKCREKAERYNNKHPGRRNEIAANYRTKYPDRVALAQKKHNQNPKRKLCQNLRIRMYHAIKKQAKRGSPIKDLGCTVQYLIKYLENQFTPGMSWSNWGLIWEIDHIQPLHSFNLLNREHFLLAAHYSNLQPLLIETHREKTSEEQRVLLSHPPTLSKSPHNEEL